MPAPPTTTRLRLLCPGLFAPADLLAGRALPTPILDRLLVRADGRHDGPCDPFETLAAAFGVRAPVDGDLPLAPLALSALAPELARDGCWFHADPVHLRPDRDRLLLFAGPGLGVEPEESAALVAAFNAHFAADGLHLAAPRPGDWYLRVEAPPRLCTHPLHAVAGRALDRFLPTGPAAPAWNRWQNEAQMLFFQHPVNRTRERAGRPPVSGVWTWGGGVLPRVGGGPGLTVADHPLARGLARAAGGRCLGLAEWSPTGPAAAGHGGGPSAGVGGLRAEEALVVWDGLWWPSLTGEAEAWCAALRDLESLAAGLWAALAGGRVRAIRLEDGEGAVFALDSRARLRFWRRRGRLRERLGVAPSGPARPPQPRS